MYSAERTISTAKELQSVLRSLLSDDLGKFKSGLTAITVEPPFAPARGSGLHCVIQRQPLMLRHEPIASIQANQSFQFLVTLTAEHSDPALAALDKAADKIRSRFPRHREIVLPVADGRLAQITFYLEFTRTINTTPI